MLASCLALRGKKTNTEGNGNVAHASVSTSQVFPPYQDAGANTKEKKETGLSAAGSSALLCSFLTTVGVAKQKRT